MSKLKSKLLTGVVSAFVLSACSMAPAPLTQQEFVDSAQKDMELMFGSAEVITKDVSLSEAIARALKYNLDHKAKAMEQALAMSQTDLDSYDLLPTVTASAGYSERSEFDATNSKSEGAGAATGSYSYSDDRSSKTGDLTLGWNILDFGVSYYNAKQNGDRHLIAEERRRKVIYNLVKEVQSAYWRMVAAQKLEQRIFGATENAKRALAQAEKVEAERLSKPEESLRYQKRLLQNLRQLEAINQELSTARIELAALINVPPGQAFKVVIPSSEDLELPEWHTDVAEMEMLAFRNNPDLREKMYLSRISVAETKKSIVSMLPGINLGYGYNYDGNSFLDENRWFEFSSTLSWNVLNLLKLPARLDFAEANEELADAQRLALRMALLAQVHVADRKLKNSISKFRQLDKLYNVNKRLSYHIGKRQEFNSRGVLEKISQETATISAELLRYQAYADVMTSIGRVHSTIGVGVVPEGMAVNDLASLGDAIAKSMQNWSTGDAIHAEVKSMKLAEEKPEVKPAEAK